MKPEYQPPADEFPSKGSSGSGTEIAYSVQARLAYHQPRQVCGHLLDLRWTTLYFEKSPIGVPVRAGSMARGHCGLLSYQAAQALRWWFLAQAELEFSCLCLETRLVEHRVEYSYSATAARAGAIIGGDDRSNIMFGWGEKTPPPIPDANKTVT